MTESHYRLSIETSTADLTVVAFRGTEALNRLYRFDIQVAVPAADVAGFATTVLQSSATLALRAGNQVPRLIHGVIAGTEAVGKTALGQASFALRLAPHLALMKLRRGSRIFQDQDAREIVDRILDLRALPRQWHIDRPLPKRAYCVQHQESDYAFIARLCAEDGIVFGFEHPKGETTETVVFSDGTRRAAFIDGPVELAYRGSNDGSGLEIQEHQLTRFVVRHAVRSTGVLLRSFDVDRPTVQRRHAASTEGKPRIDTIDSMRTMVSRTLAIYEHGNAREQALPEATSATTYLDGERADALVAKGVGSCRRVLPGRRFRLTGHEIPEVDGDYTITRVDHEGYASERTPVGKLVYSNRFACVPAAISFRARQPRPRVRQGMETASVVGPAGHEIHTDDLGRIKVQFHWDLEGTNDDRSSCWLRVAQAWAGAGFGSQFLPRVGMEVLVGFVGGDPDRPVVTGCLYNGTHPPPFAQAKGSQSGLRTRSYPAGEGFNELLFDDKSGSELVSLRAERNMSLTARGNLRLESSGNVYRQTTETEEHRVGGDLTTAVEGSRSSHVEGASRTVIDGAQHHAIGGNSTYRVSGNAVVRVGGTSRRTVLGDDHTTVGNAAGGDQAASLSVNGFYQLAASKQVALRSSGSIELSVGRTRLTITERGITMVGPELNVEEADVSFVHSTGTSYAFGGDLEIGASKVTIASSGASLVLDSEAKLDGALVKLGSGPAAVGPHARSGSEVPSSVTFELADYELVSAGSPVSLVVSLPTGEVVEKPLDASGRLVLDAREGDRFTLIDIKRNGESIPGRVKSQ